MGVCVKAIVGESECKKTIIQKCEIPEAASRIFAVIKFKLAEGADPVQTVT